MDSKITVALIGFVQALAGIWLKHYLETRHVFNHTEQSTPSLQGAPLPLPSPPSLKATLKRMVFWFVLCFFASFVGEMIVNGQLGHGLAYIYTPEDNAITERRAEALRLADIPADIFAFLALWQFLLLCFRLLKRWFW